MIIKPGDIIEVKLGANVATNQLSYYISYTGNATISSKFGYTYNTSNIALLPPFTYNITISSLVVTNLDTAPAIVKIQINSNNTRVIVFTTTLQPGESLQYDGNEFILPTQASSGGGCIINNYLGTPTNVRQDYITGEPIDAGQAVFVDSDGLLYIMDITNSSHFGKCIGIAEDTVISGVACTVITHGYSAQVGSGWVAGDIYYIDTDAFLVNTSPVVGWQQKVGVGVDSDVISINLETGLEII